MKVVSVKIKNFKGLESAEVNLLGSSVFLVGANQSGKTSFIDAVFYNMPDRPLKNGAHKGFVELDIDAYKIKYTFSEDTQKPKLEITSKDGIKQPAPATLLKQLFGVVDFNIDDFLSKSDSKQLEEIKSLAGIDFTDLDDRYKELYTERTIVNRKIKELEAKKAGHVFDLRLLDKKDVAEKQKQLNEGIKKNNDINNVLSGVAQKKQSIESNAKRKDQLKAELLKLNEEAATLLSDITKGEEWLAANQSIDISIAQTEINEIYEFNEKVTLNLQHKGLNEELILEAKKDQDINLEMDNILTSKKKAIQEANLPVTGLSFDDEKIYLDGLPFKSNQINTARRIIAGLEISYALLGQVRIARFDGSLLDKSSMEAVKEWAKEKDLQLFVEIVDREGNDFKIDIQEE